jgi:hypothetical protein
MVHAKKCCGLKTLSFTLAAVLLGTSINIPQTSKANAASSTSSATISVDANVSQGTLFRSEQYFNIAKQSTYPEAQASRSADIQFLNDQGLHTKIQRAWLNESEIYDEATGLFNKFDRIDAYLTQVSDMGEELLINLRAEKVIKEFEYTPAQIKPIVKEYIKHIKQNFPKVKYLEVTNEPDAPPNSDANYYRIDPVTKKQTTTNILSPSNYYSYYKAFSDAVNEVNAELKPSVPLQVGGPALYNFDLHWLKGFLDGYKDDTSPTKKLDFISYHGYLRIDPSTGRYLFYKETPTIAIDERAQLEAELRSRGISTDIPSFITETGMYPGPLTDTPDSIGGVQPDQLRQAAGMASQAYWYSTSSSKNYPFGWNVRHNGGNGRKDSLVSRDSYNKLLNPIYSDKFTPFGNMRVMQSKMKTTKVSATSDSIDSKGKGVYALASKDDTGISLMVWNYQGTGTTEYNAAVNVTNLPSIFNGKNVRVKTYKIDSTTSNYFASLDNSNLQMVDDKIVPHKGNYTTSVQLESNSLQLLVLEPESKNVFLKNSFNDEVTGAEPGWMVSEPADTAVSIANVPSVTDRSVYLSDNSSTHSAVITKSFEGQSAAITAQWRFKDDADLRNDRFQLMSGDTVAIDIYVNADNNLVANDKVIQSVKPSTWYTVKLKTNPVSNKYEIFVDDTLKASGIPYSAQVPGLDTVSFQTGEATRNSLYIDDVAVYRGSLPL